MTTEAERFYESIPERDAMPVSELVDYFVYFLTVVDERPVASIPEIKRCFDACHLSQLARLPAYLSESSKGPKPKFLKTIDGYRLERGRREQISATLGKSPKRMQSEAELHKLLARMA